MRDILFCLRFLLALSWRTDRRRLLLGGTLLLLGFLATPLAALALRGLVNTMLAGQRDDAARWAVLAAALLICELMLGHFAHLAYFELGEVNEETLSRELLRVINGGPGLERCDDPRFADGVDLLRQDILRMRMTVQAVLQLGGLAAQAALTMVILAGILPWLLFLPLAAVIPVLSGKQAERQLEQARERAAPVARAIRHLRALAASGRSQSEIRLAGSGAHLIARQEELQRRLARVLGRGQRRHAALRGVGQFAFALAYVGSLALTFQLARRQEATVGDVVLVVVLTTAVSAQVSGGIELLSSVHAAAAGFRRLVDLRAATGSTARAATGRAAASTATARTAARTAASTAPARTAGRAAAGAATAGAVVHGATDRAAAGRLAGAARLVDGITLERVGFHYPDSAEPVLRDVDLRLPAGTSVALVGENGAGKSTLIKLLNALYPPTTGRIRVDGADLAALDAAAWQTRTATLFQDFARLHFSLRHSVGVGRLADVESDPAIVAAIRRAGADGLLRRLDGDLDTLLGKGYGDGTDLSGGQWQSVGFARTLMRPDPLLLCLDEPGHALDALAEQRMYDAYQAIARDLAARHGTVTVYVTHRMSTVRLADLIVVLDRGGVAEFGSHPELLARGGRYAELYRLQSRAYA